MKVEVNVSACVPILVGIASGFGDIATFNTATLKSGQISLSDYGL